MNRSSTIGTKMKRVSSSFSGALDTPHDQNLKKCTHILREFPLSSPLNSNRRAKALMPLHVKGTTDQTLPLNFITIGLSPF